MKSIKNIFKTGSVLFSAFIGLTFAGCDLDVELPTTIDPDTYWKTESDARSFLNTIYGSSKSSAGTMLYLDVYTDDVYNRHTHEASGYLFIQDALSSGEPKFENHYNWNFFNIRMVNMFLANVDKVPMSETLKERMKLEARFWRAWDYMFKTVAWGKVPLLGDEVFDYDLPTISRSPQTDVFNYIITEAAACEALPDSYSGSDQGRVTKWAAKALKAKAQLFSGRYSDAALTAKDIIDNGGFDLKKITNDPSLIDPREYIEMDQFMDWSALGIDKDDFLRGIYSYNAIWTAPDNNPEYILTRQYKDESGFTDMTRYTFIRPAQCNTSDGWSSITPTQNLVDAYWNADGTEFVPPAQSVRYTNFSAMDNEWIADNSATQITVDAWAQEKIKNNTLKDYLYMQEFRNRDARLYASILFPYKQWNLSDVGDFTYRYRWRTSPNEQNNESKTGFNWRKMSALSSSKANSMHAATVYPVIRLAEIILIYAEAQTLANGYDATVAEQLNRLRDRVGMPDVPASLSDEDAIDLIRHERRIELAGEGKRAEDVSRYDEEYWKAHMDGVSIFAPNSRDVSNAVLTMKWSSRMRLKPIPSKAVDLNPALQADQNPGWD